MHRRAEAAAWAVSLGRMRRRDGGSAVSTSCAAPAIALTMRLVASLVWISMATALWHFTIFIPDRFVGGMIGAFLCANGAAVAAGLSAAGFSIPAKTDVTRFDAVLGGLAGGFGLAVAYAWGTRRNHRRDRFQAQ